MAEPRMTAFELEFLRDLLKRAKLGPNSVAKTGTGETAFTLAIMGCGGFQRFIAIDSPSAEALARAPEALGRALEIIADARALARIGDVGALKALLDFPAGSKKEAKVPDG